MEKKILSLTLLIIFLAMFPIVSAEVMNVECARDSDCGNGEVCQMVGPIENWECVKGQGDPSLQNIPATNQNSSSDNNSILIASVIIGVCIVIGFIILAIILSRKKK